MPSACERIGANRAARAMARQGGFTLLEVCIVLLIIAIMAGMLVPAMQSSFSEEAMRSDTREFSLMVKTAMLQCSEQHRPYVIEFTGGTLALHPLAAPTTDDASSPAPATASDVDNTPTLEDVSDSQKLDAGNKLLLPNPDKPNAWLPAGDVTWQFDPGALCPVPRIRVVRSRAWIEISYNALTGNPENESAFLP